MRAPGKRECHRCNKKLWRQRNPYRAAYRICKDKAAQRRSRRWPNGIPWEITFAAFVIYARRTQYLTKKGNSGESITIDRKDHTKGYVPGNIKPLTRSQNAIKQAKEQQHRHKAGFAWQRR